MLRDLLKLVTLEQYSLFLYNNWAVLRPLLTSLKFTHPIRRYCWKSGTVVFG